MGEIFGVNVKFKPARPKLDGDSLIFQRRHTKMRSTTGPKRILVKNPKDIPTRIWGQYEESKPQDICLPVIDMSSLVNQAADLEGTKKVIEEIDEAKRAKNGAVSRFAYQSAIL
ncbi:unnamed protein product [Calypogeia fissa]